MIWLYMIAIAVLIGAALNASFDRLWPESAPQQARVELVRRLRRARLLRTWGSTGRHAEDGSEIGSEIDTEIDGDARRRAR